MVVVTRVIVAMARTRYRRRRSGMSSTASSRGRIRVRVPIQRVLSVPVASGSYDSRLLRVLLGIRTLMVPLTPMPVLPVELFPLNCIVRIRACMTKLSVTV